MTNEEIIKAQNITAELIAGLRDYVSRLASAGTRDVKEVISVVVKETSCAPGEVTPFGDNHIRLSWFIEVAYPHLKSTADPLLVEFYLSLNRIYLATGRCGPIHRVGKL